MPRVVHFEMHSDKPERAIRFYSGVFGWEFTKREGDFDYYRIKTGSDEPGIDGCLVKRQGGTDGDAILAFICTIDVDNIATYLEKVKQHGGIQVVPTMPVEGIGWAAYCKGPEGNIFRLRQLDPEAK